MSNQAKVDEITQDLDFAAKKYRVDFETTAGPIRLNLNSDVAPGHCRNLIGLARIGFYDNLSFHRIIEGFMIQGGCPEGTGTGGPGYQIKAEFNDMPHEPGVLSMARSQNPDSAGSQFFVCLAKHPHLDGNYTAFGSTADEASMQTVASIGQVETDSRDCPMEPVMIVSVSVVEVD
ncbi:MAG: peptidylprolyl isomerase [Planctomycetota bacterium]|jgi:peptidyl-prolyl cis-trans isomerase B (cyclophilin B)|nr:peptidylprolyl isomerase [Planctomycetota bacterium]MEC8304995.1 peptidylprolyl isomerase [Planctomycetota bacterium]MEC8345984.1 peptidylprolyl isomerase [Planctomycetota bacterium]MEC8506546.1 peptidylprolyl isomerase [Planctomycetota bacterium]MED5285811.1 peptidylprolyl isomerase [Planctomycetota bacterium]